jgi:hypothetical protein
MKKALQERTCRSLKVCASSFWPAVERARSVWVIIDTVEECGDVDSR